MNPIINKIILPNNNELTFPDISDTLITLNAVQTLTNKTLIDPIINNIITSNNNTINLIDTNDTLVNTSSNQILQNKLAVSEETNKYLLNSIDGYNIKINKLNEENKNKDVQISSLKLECVWDSQSEYPKCSPSHKPNERVSWRAFCCEKVETDAKLTHLRTTQQHHLALVFNCVNFLNKNLRRNKK
jgi:hypothetical protein